MRCTRCTRLGPPPTIPSTAFLTTVIIIATPSPIMQVVPLPSPPSPPTAHAPDGSSAGHASSSSSSPPAHSASAHSSASPAPSPAHPSSSGSSSGPASSASSAASSGSSASGAIDPLEFDAYTDRLYAYLQVGVWGGVNFEPIP